MRLALDTVAHAVAEALEAAGHEVVLRRGQEEPSDVWLERVFESPADAVVSQARWVGRTVWKEGLYFVRVPGSVPAAEQVEPTLKNLDRCARSHAETLTKKREWEAVWNLGG